MCGGRGSRFEADVEKPMYPIGGAAMVDRVRDALVASRVDTIYAVVSSNAPETRAHLDDMPTIETPGDGYVTDLDRAIQAVDSPALSVAADLPLLTGDAVDVALRAHEGGPLTVCVPAAIKRRLGVTLDESAIEAGGRTVVPTGLNVVDQGDETRFVVEDVRFAVNVNRLADARIAEALR